MLKAQLQLHIFKSMHNICHNICHVIIFVYVIVKTIMQSCLISLTMEVFVLIIETDLALILGIM